MSLYSVSVQDQSLSAAAVQTLWQLRSGATRYARIREWGVSFDGVNATNVPVKCELIRQTNNGTATPYTPIRWSTMDPAALTSAATAFSGEPASGELLTPFRVTPNGGILVMQYAFDSCPVLPISSQLGFRCTAPATVNATAYVVFEE